MILESPSVAGSVANPFTTAQTQLDQAAAILDLPSDVHQLLREPMAELHVRIPVRMDDGRTETFSGYRVQYNGARGPCKGGIRFHPDETIDTVRALAAWMTWKTALADLPLGGGKGGVVCNPKTMSPGELERLSRGYMRAIANFVGPDKDVPAPDVYTNSQIMAWMLDEYEVIQGRHAFGVITGKPLALGGSPGRDDATARGGMFVLREAARHVGIELCTATVAIQGFGNAGAHAHNLMTQLFGSKVVAVSDSKGAIFNAAGLNDDAVAAFKEDTGSVSGFPGSKSITNEELLELDVDILIPAALENVITAENAPRIKAKIIAELANGPTTPQADDILYKQGSFVLPDFLCNGGGVTVSYFEQVQNAAYDRWKLSHVHERLEETMKEAFHHVIAAGQKFGVHNRTAAYLVAVQRVVEACRLRGWVR